MLFPDARRVRTPKTTLNYFLLVLYNVLNKCNKFVVSFLCRNLVRVFAWSQKSPPNFVTLDL